MKTFTPIYASHFFSGGLQVVRLQAKTSIKTSQLSLKNGTRGPARGPYVIGSAHLKYPLYPPLALLCVLCVLCVQVTLTHIDGIACSVNITLNIVIMSLNYYEKAVDQHAHVGSIRIAYRKFGAETGIPLTLLIHFR